MCVSVRYQTPFSSRHESGPSLFLSTGKHPVGGQLPRVFFSALPGQSRDRPNLPPHKKLSIFQFPFASIRRATSEACSGLGKRRIDRSTSKRSSKKLQRATITAFFLDRSLVVVHCDRSWPVDDRHESENNACAYCMPVDLLPVLAVDLLRSTGAASNRVRFAGSVSCFTSIDRARRSSPVVRAICQRSIGSVSTASKRRHMAWCCVCMQVNETGHAQRLNMLKQRPMKWFFVKKLTFFHRWRS